MNQVAAAEPAAPRYLQKAIDTLRAAGVGPREPEAAPVTALIERIADTHSDSALVIARTLSQQEVFDEAVAEQISKMRVGSRFQDITAAFDSIRDDAQRLVGQAEKDSLDLRDRFSNIVMKLRRGDIADRFDAVRAIYREVIADVEEQVRREKTILAAYADYRGALKEAEAIAWTIKEDLAAVLEAARAEAARAADAVEGSGKGASRARAELERDEAQRAMQAAEGRWQIAKDLAENLMIAYSVTEVTMARMAQSHAAKDRMWQQAVAFFSTNGSVLSALKASYTGMLGLNEITKASAAMQEGVSRSLESLADLGFRAGEAAVRQGYGPTIRADAVRRLVDSVVEFQASSQATIAEMRTLATENAREIRESVEEGKSRVAKLALKPVPVS